MERETWLIVYCNLAFVCLSSSMGAKLFYTFNAGKTCCVVVSNTIIPDIYSFITDLEMGCPLCLLKTCWYVTKRSEYSVE